MTLKVNEKSADYTGMISGEDYQEYIRYDGDDQSTILPLLIETSIRAAESYCNASFGTKTYEVYFNDVVGGCGYELPFGNIRSVTEVAELTDVDGDVPSETVITSGFKLSADSEYIIFNSPGSYKVSYSSGLADPSTINKHIKHGILLILSENFENREEVVLGQSVAKLPRNSKVILAPFRNKIL